MSHPADDLQALLEHAYAQISRHRLGDRWIPPFGVALGEDGNCSAFQLTDPPSTFYDAVQELMVTLRHEAERVCEMSP